jgi:signal transduction histidine kinase
VRLASKIFFASSLVILVLVGVAVQSLRAIDRLVSVNREITSETVPALRLGASSRDAIQALARLEARLLVLRDPQYVTLWEERADRLRADLEELHALVQTRREIASLNETRTAFEAYRQLVAQEQALVRAGDRQLALQLAEKDAHPIVEQIQASLEDLMQARYAVVARAQADAAALERRTWARVLVALGAALALALVGSAVIAHRITRSLRTVSAATTAVAGGSFRDPVPVVGNDEIAELARAFNAMAARLRQMDETKQEFFARISHELRSPLTSVREAAHLLGDGVPGALNPKQARLVAIVAQSSDRLLRLVNQLLELSRVRAGLIPLERRRVDLDRVATRVLEELRPQAEEAGVSLERDRVGQNFVCFGDEDRLLQALVNLVGNAIRFTPRHGTVRLRLVDAAPELELMVEDSGVGIPAEALPTIFDSYQQAHRDRGGTGLGLAIVRSVVEAHGGRVTVESQEGKGSRFTILLSRGRDAG